jgi:hypothetical protein
MLGRVVSSAPAEILVPERAGGSAGLPVEWQIVGRQESSQSDPALSYTVDRLPARTIAKHGISGPELVRLSAALRFMELHCRPRRSKLWWISVAKGSNREVISTIQRRITKLQGLCGLPKYSAWIFETLGGIHPHITFIGDADGEIAGALHRSEISVKLSKSLLSLIQPHLFASTWPKNERRRRDIGGSICLGAG